MTTVDGYDQDTGIPPVCKIVTSWKLSGERDEESFTIPHLRCWIRLIGACVPELFIIEPDTGI